MHADRMVLMIQLRHDESAQKETAGYLSVTRMGQKAR